MATLTLSTQNFAPIADLYVFGDSLSDMGTVFRATGGLYPPNPPYFQGRYSNGRVWVEYLADQLNLSSEHIHNVACGGATTGRDVNSLVPGLLPQVEAFTQAHREVDRTALYVLWAGANDYLQGVVNSVTPVEHVTQAIAALQAVGAQRILVANLPDLGELPATRTGANAAALNQLSQSHNQNLRRSLKRLTQQQPELQIVTLDANALYRAAIVNPAQFGFTNVTSACVSGAAICRNPDQCLFWDGIHPTTAAHQILGEAAFEVVQAAGMVDSQFSLN